MKIEAATRLIAAGWFDAMTPEQQQQYLKLHPKSRQAQSGKGTSAPTTETKPAAKPKSIDEDIADGRKKLQELTQRMREEEAQEKKDKDLADYMKRRRARQVREQKS